MPQIAEWIIWAIRGWGLFYLVEGGANLVYWYLYGGGIKDNPYWQIGRLIRTIGGLVLILLSLYV